jgi:predicted methyltransferase MtxX (methanogen marker protein 4)
MRPEDILNNAIESIKSGIDKVDDTYESHIREKAIKEVNKKIEEKGLDIEQIQNDDYEAMISDLSKDIKADYAKKAAQGLFAFIGLDMLLGI